MAEKDPKKAPSKTSKTSADEAALAGSELQIFAQEYEEDSRNMKIAFTLAIIIHLGLLLVQIPELATGPVAEPEKPKVYVVQQVRFRPPPPKQQQEIPKKRTKKVPIPDPTPDEPEPIRLEEEIEPEVDLPDTDILFDIPEGPPPAEPEGPIMVGGDVKAPVKIESPAPAYTEIARKARIQGIVIVQAVIDKEGHVTNVKILKGLPMGLDTAAMEAVRRWRFQPATLNGKPVSVYYNLTVNFTLQ